VPPYKKIITDQERKRFIAQLMRYASGKGHKIILIFDGGSYEWPIKEKYASVLVVYSGIHESADDYIKEYIALHRAKDLLLVTSDRELNRRAESFAIPSIDSYVFYQLLQEVKKQEKVKNNTNPAVKMTVDTKEDIDSIMINASKIVAEKLEDTISKKQNRISKKRQSDKEERILLKKLRKL
jgi:predicted RNA-binding protein with PIN domain